MLDGILTARWVLPVSAPPIEDGALYVREGRIVACGRREELVASWPEAPLEDLGESALLPGLVNAHAHLELTALRGLLETEDFFRWIRQLTQTKYERLSAEEIALSSALGVMEASAAGVTTLGEVCDLGVSLDAIRKGGLRSILYQEVFGPDPKSAEQSLGDLRSKIAARRAAVGPRIEVGVSPHAPYTVSDRLFAAVARWATEESLPLAVHAAESAEEEAFVHRGEGPFAGLLRGRGIEWRARGVSPIEYLDGLGVLGPRSLVIHAVRCTAADVDRLAERGASVVHCPRSNAKFGHGLAPLALFQEAGIPVGLGSDSVASSNSCDLFEEARLALVQTRARRSDGTRDRKRGRASSSCDEAVSGLAGSARAGLHLLTLGGAQALGMQDRIGSLEAGKLADVTVVDVSGAHMQPLHDIEAALAWSARASDVALTAVEGEVIYQRGQWTHWDLETMRQPLDVLVRRLQG